MKSSKQQMEARRRTGIARSPRSIDDHALSAVRGGGAFDGAKASVCVTSESNGWITTICI